MSAVVFAVLALLAVGSAAGVLLKRNPIHAALFLVTNLSSVAGLYLTLGAEFLAAAQIIVYAGAIAVLFVFAIMVLIPGKEETGPDPLRRQRVMAAPVVGVFLIIVMLVLWSVAPRGPAAPAAVPGGVIALGRLLFTDYLFPFEVTSLLLLVAIVGVIALTKRRMGSE